MKILIAGVCGFVGSTIAKNLASSSTQYEIYGFDNFIRQGSEINIKSLKQLGITVLNCDLRNSSDIINLPKVDFVIDAAANPSVLAGLDKSSSSRVLVENNLNGTINILEYCKKNMAGLILLSTSRVYSINILSELPLFVTQDAYNLNSDVKLPAGLSALGVSENFSTTSPISLYGSTKLASEIMALEYGNAFDFPVYVNRCGVLAGAGQFGKPDQGIFSYWINCWLRDRELKHIGFNGTGYQVRDILHPNDLIPVLENQFKGPEISNEDRICNFSGGILSSISLKQLSGWCAERFGQRSVIKEERPRKYDLPWVVLDYSKASRIWNFKPRMCKDDILCEIANHAKSNPNWLNISGA